MKQFRFFSYFIVLYLTFNQGQSNEDKTKPSMIEEIVYKITNMTLKSISQATAPEKEKILKDIEEKVKMSASTMGVDGHKYVKIIMHGVKLVAFNHTNETDKESTTTEKEILIAKSHNESAQIFGNDEQKTKEQAIISIAAKIEKLANKYLKEVNTKKDRFHIIENIRNKVIDTANRRRMMIHNKHDKVKSFSNLVAKGVDLMMKRNFENEANLEYRVTVAKTKNKRRTESSYTNMAVHSDHNFDRLDCNFEIEKTCIDLKSLNKFTCIYDNKVFPLEKLCDGIIDCFDRSDERNCVDQAIGKIRKVERIMAKIDGFLNRKCVMQDLSSPFVSKQNDVLRSVLQSQLKFIEKYTGLTSSPILYNVNVNAKKYGNPKGVISKNVLSKTANEVALVVSSLGMALDGTLCARRASLENLDNIAKKYVINAEPDQAFEDLLEKQSTVFRSCNCNGLYCSNTDCTETCKRVCWQKYNLERWSCKAVGDAPSVPLNAICDGKLDCYDESDESGCVVDTGYTKFEANSMYDSTLKLLSTKTNSKEYHWISNELLALRDTIKLLQKLSTKRNVEIMNIKIVREQIFKTLKDIYDKYSHKGDEKSLNDIYNFLISLNEKLVGAMKQSSTGNERIISSAGCYCTGTRCGIPNCSQLCIRACSVETILVRYNCGSVKLNYSVPIESLCDGESSCPNGEDELGCQKEVCRHHHLVVLQHNLQDVGNKQKGTGLGEALISWRTKVTSTLSVAEKNGRPNPKIFKRIISDILHDLVMAYGSLEEFRRNTNERTVKVFERISQRVIESIKTCGK